jgi:hypothetical protein
MLTARVAGIRRTSWFCHYLKPLIADDSGSPTNWSTSVASMGLHNDIGTGAEYSDFAARAAWRRPSWFTFRRVAWLLSLARDQGTAIRNSKGVTVLRFELNTRTSFNPLGGVGRRFLWVAWVDQYSDDACLHAARPFVPYAAAAVDERGPGQIDLVLYDTGGRGYELVSLVPDVSEHAREGEVDANGYRQCSDRDWHWDGWDGALLDHGEVSRESDGFTMAWFRIDQCRPERGRAPVAILTDAREAVIT